MINAPFNRPAAVMLSAVWTIAALLAAAAFAVSAFAGEAPRSARPTNGHAAGAETVDRLAASSMLRQPRLSISKDKLD